MKPDAQHDGERGATSVEAALVLPLVILVLLTVVWVGFFFRGYLSAANASATGGRAAAISATDVDADYYTLQAMQSSFAGIGKGNLVRVVIYKPATGTSAPTDTCRQGIASSVCNVYGAADLTRSATEFGTGGWSGDDHFPATGRGSGADATRYVGVYTEVRISVAGMGLPIVNSVGQHRVVALEPRG